MLAIVNTFTNKNNKNDENYVYHESLPSDFQKISINHRKSDQFENHTVQFYNLMSKDEQAKLTCLTVFQVQLSMLHFQAYRVRQTYFSYKPQHLADRMD